LNGVHILINCSGSDTANALRTVLAPDNEDFPSGMKFEAESWSRYLAFTIESEKAGSVLTTTESVLRDADLFQEVWLLSSRAKGIARRAKRRR